MLDDDRLAALFAQRRRRPSTCPRRAPTTSWPGRPDASPRRCRTRLVTARTSSTAGTRLDGQTRRPELDGTTARRRGLRRPPGAPGRLRRVTGLASRHRVLSVAACLVRRARAGRGGRRARTRPGPVDPDRCAGQGARARPGPHPVDDDDDRARLRDQRSVGAGPAGAALQHRLTARQQARPAACPARPTTRPPPHRRRRRLCPRAPSASPPESSRPARWS